MQNMCRFRVGARNSIRLDTLAFRSPQRALGRFAPPQPQTPQIAVAIPSIMLPLTAKSAKAIMG